MKRSVTRKRNEFYTKNFCALNSAGFPDCPDEEKQSQAEDSFRTGTMWLNATATSRRRRSSAGMSSQLSNVWIKLLALGFLLAVLADSANGKSLKQLYKTHTDTKTNLILATASILNFVA